MNKLVIIISLLILFLNNCFAKDELKFFIGNNKIDLEGYFIQGGYVKGKTSSKIKIKFENRDVYLGKKNKFCLLYTSPSPRDKTVSRMPSSA